MAMMGAGLHFLSVWMPSMCQTNAPCWELTKERDRCFAAPMKLPVRLRLQSGTERKVP